MSVDACLCFLLIPFVLNDMFLLIEAGRRLDPRYLLMIWFRRRLILTLDLLNGSSGVAWIVLLGLVVLFLTPFLSRPILLIGISLLLLPIGNLQWVKIG